MVGKLPHDKSFQKQTLDQSLVKSITCGEKLYFFSYVGSIQPMKYIYNNEKERKRKKKEEKESIRKNPYKLGKILTN